jgi:hypothetical protein
MIAAVRLDLRLPLERGPSQSDVTVTVTKLDPRPFVSAPTMTDCARSMST